MSDLLNKWLAHYDPIHRGWTPAGIANGVCTTSGYSFPRIRGGYNLRRACGRPAHAADVIVGAAGIDAAEVRTFPWVRHEPDSSCEYALTAISGGGIENWTQAARCSVGFDAAGQWLGPHPNQPRDLRVKELAGGRFLLRWTYAEAGQAVAPAEFRVYTDHGGEAVDYSRPEGLVAYRSRRMHFAFISAAFPEAARVRWAVRAASLAGLESAGTCEASGLADAAGPAARAVVLADVV